MITAADVAATTTITTFFLPACQVFVSYFVVVILVSYPVLIV
jgi:hypothetical protein